MSFFDNKWFPKPDICPHINILYVTIFISIIVMRVKLSLRYFYSGFQSCCLFFCFSYIFFFILDGFAIFALSTSKNRSEHFFTFRSTKKWHLLSNIKIHQPITDSYITHCYYIDDHDIFIATKRHNRTEKKRSPKILNIKILMVKLVSTM